MIVQSLFHCFIECYQFYEAPNNNDLHYNSHRSVTDLLCRLILTHNSNNCDAECTNNNYDSIVDIMVTVYIVGGGLEHHFLH